MESVEGFMKPIISVIMLTYNRENLISRAVESVLNQTFTDFEFIIVNNGSTDQSGAIAEDYAKKDPRIRVIHRSKGNIGSGRNTGLDVAVGDYIAFIDDDDWCEPDFLEFLYNLATYNNADVSICGAADKVFDEKHIMTTEEAMTRLLWRKKYNMQFPTKLIKKTLFSKLRFSESAKYDDIELMPKIFAAANKIAYHGISKYTFHRHTGNNSAWTTDHSLLDAETLSEYLKVYRTRTDWLVNIFPEGAAKWRYFEWSFMISMVEKVERLKITGCEPQTKMMLEVLSKNKNTFLSSSYILDFEKEWVKRYI